MIKFRVWFRVLDDAGVVIEESNVVVEAEDAEAARAKVTAAIPADLRVAVDNAEQVKPKCNAMFCALDAHEGDHHVDVTGHGWDEPTPVSPVIAHIYGGTED